MGHELRGRNGILARHGWHVLLRAVPQYLTNRVTEPRHGVAFPQVLAPAQRHCVLEATRSPGPAGDQGRPHLVARMRVMPPFGEGDPGAGDPGRPLDPGTG